jgi:hypothetical protein
MRGRCSRRWGGLHASKCRYMPLMQKLNNVWAQTLSYELKFLSLGDIIPVPAVTKGHAVEGENDRAKGGSRALLRTHPQLQRHSASQGHPPHASGALCHIKLWLFPYVNK